MKSKDVKEEEVVRVPIAFAMVKLMQTLPPHIMEANLPGYAVQCECMFPENQWLRKKGLVCFLYTGALKELFYSPGLYLSSSILIKVCVLLRNRFQEIRDVARGTLVKIIETLGRRYLHYLLKEMQSVLVKGYQV